jgi:hypothetical protein
VRHGRNWKKYNHMSYAEKLAFMATANRVTIGKITQVTATGLKDSYIPKVRGFFIGEAGSPGFETPFEARQAGEKILKQWKAEYQDMLKAAGGDE